MAVVETQGAGVYGSGRERDGKARTEKGIGDQRSGKPWIGKGRRRATATGGGVRDREPGQVTGVITW
ncbi:hypothetical protein CERSUDRAFT_101576 [Gelatoporia subvermispora B]|uniref:Uncharacterized protein n=1 Tax=Ceriporiopsis subvermispora (strain B) TaxID=914234 RepID=M2Q0C4_CERS8|nr:hypothetical protein CERSUDRAFT_101576 [Gelatoporia subvermispora B]